MPTSLHPLKKLRQHARFRQHQMAGVRYANEFFWLARKLKQLFAKDDGHHVVALACKMSTGALTSAMRKSERN